MRVPVDLSLLREGFLQLAQTPYFDERLNRVALDVVAAIDAILSQSPPLADQASREFARALWMAHKYLAGSTVSESPYEIEFCLRLALADWVNDECVVATTLRTDLDFHFWLLDIGSVIDAIVTSYVRKSNVRLIPIALPRLYKNRPLYCTPLYHELGHFVDNKFAITDLTLLRFPGSQPPSIERNHRAEHFADLFAAQYVGCVAARTLEQIADGHPASPTHPATADRIARVNAFLSGTPDPIVDQFNAVLDQVGLPQLQTRHSYPNIQQPLDEIRPVGLADKAELHGLFPAAWEYLDEVHSGLNPTWVARGRKFDDVDRIVNDLIEKSIRNHAVVEQWDATSN